MNTIILPVVFQNIAIITVIIYCKKANLLNNGSNISTASLFSVRSHIFLHTH